MKLVETKEYLLLIDEEAEIEYDNLVYNTDVKVFYNISIQALPVVNPANVKPIAYYPLTKEAKALDLPLLPNPFEEVDIEKLAENHVWEPIDDNEVPSKESFIKGYKAAQPKRFSLENMKKAIEMARENKPFIYHEERELPVQLGEFQKYSDEEIIQALSTQQLPKSFEPEYEYYDACHCNSIGYKADPKGCAERNHCEIGLKTITNSEGKETIVGTYKY